MSAEGLQPQESAETRKARLIDTIAAALQAKWQEDYAANPKNHAEDGSVKPRPKTTTDKEWAAAHQASEVDISTTPYAELPSDWQAENHTSAEIAFGLIDEAKAAGRPLDDAFLEEASAVIHEKWRDRNKEHAPADEDVPYAELSDYLKNLDRDIMRTALGFVG